MHYSITKLDTVKKTFGTFCLLPQAAILDVLGKITPPMYTSLYHTPNLPLRCPLPLSKYPASKDLNT